MGRIKTGKIQGDELQSFTSVQNWLSSLSQASKSKGKEDLTLGAKRQRLGRMLEYTKFTGCNPDQLLEEAKQDINKAGTRLDQFFKQRCKDGIDWNTACTNLSYLRGFYSHNDLTFPKRYRLPSRKVSKVSKRDEKVPIYDYNEENGEAIFNNKTLQHLVQNLNFRDQTIALALLSSGQDANDLLKLDIGFVKDGMGKLCMRKRFFWKGNREKDGIEFKTMFSEEATEFIRRYVEQERAGAKNDEPLFVRKFDKTVGTDNDGKRVTETQTTRLEVAALAFNFKSAAEKMGYKVTDESNPFRPKRFRHLFRTAMSCAHVEEGYVQAMMGHATSISHGYLEKSDGLFIQEYIKAEPYLTVFGLNKEAVTEMNEKVYNVEKSVVDQAQEITKLKEELATQKSYFDELVKAITNESVGQFKEWLETKRKLEFQQTDNEEKRKLLSK
jgi:integrase